MKRRIAIAATAVLIGCSSMIVGDTTKASNTIDNNYLKTDNLQTDLTQVYYTFTEDDFNTLMPIVENRNGKIIIEVIQGTVLDSDGNGIDSCGNYIHYDMDKFSIGDKVQSIFVYNPDSNAIDDILYRVDTLIEQLALSI